MFLEVMVGAGAGAATLSRLIAKEDGPYRIFPRFRDWAVSGVRAFEAAHPESRRRIQLLNEALSILECPICQSVWWGALLALVGGVAIGMNPALIVLAMLGAPAVAWALGSLGLW